MQMDIRPPILPRASMRLHRKTILDELSSMTFEEGTPIWEYGSNVIALCIRLQNTGKNVSERFMMNKIVESLPSCWGSIIEFIFNRLKSDDSLDFLEILEEAERDIHPLWIELETTKMDLGTGVTDHLLKKESIYNELKRRGFRPNIAILVYAIVNTLPDEWPKKMIQNNLKNDFKDLKALEEMLKDTEFDLLCSKAADEVEKTLMDQDIDGSSRTAENF